MSLAILLRSGSLLPRSLALSLKPTAHLPRTPIALRKTPCPRRLTHTPTLHQARAFSSDNDQSLQSSPDNVNNSVLGELPTEQSKVRDEPPSEEEKTPTSTNNSSTEAAENRILLNYPIGSPARLSSYQSARCLYKGSQITLHCLRMYKNTPLFSPSFEAWRAAHPKATVGDALQHVFHKGFPRDITTYNGILYELAMAGLPKEATEIFSHMAENGIQINGESYATVINGYLGRRKVGAAVRMFQTVFTFYTEQANTDAPLNSSVFTRYFMESGISALVANKDVKGAHMLWSFSVKNNISISRRAVSALIAAGGEAGEAGLVWDIRDAMLRSGEPAMEELIHSIMSAHAAANDFGGLWDMWQAISFKSTQLSKPNKVDLRGFIEDGQVLHRFAKMAADSCVTGRHTVPKQGKYYGDRTRAEMMRNKISPSLSDQRLISIVLEACGKLPRQMVELPANGIKTQDSVDTNTMPLGAVLARHAQCSFQLCNGRPNFYTRCKYVQALSMQGAWQQAERILFETKPLKPSEIAESQRICLNEMHKKTPKKAKRILSEWDVQPKSRKARPLPDGVGGIPLTSVLATLPTAHNPPIILLSDQKFSKEEKKSFKPFYPAHSITYENTKPPMIRPELVVTVGTLLQVVAELGLEKEYHRISERCIKELDGLARIGNLRIQDGLMPMSAMLDILSNKSGSRSHSGSSVVAETDVTISDSKEAVMEREEGSIEQSEGESIINADKERTIDDAEDDDDDDDEDDEEEIEAGDSDFLKAMLHQYQNDISRSR